MLGYDEHHLHVVAQFFRGPPSFLAADMQTPIQPSRMVPCSLLAALRGICLSQTGFLFALFLVLLPISSDSASGQEIGTTSQASAITFQPDQSQIPVPPPANAIILLDNDRNRFLSMAGKAIDWPVENGVATSKRSGDRVNHIVSTVHFRDADIHVEFMVAPEGEGNSGIYIHGHYEMQIFNSWGKKESNINEHDQGALYGFQKPLANASRKPGEWQVYDIRYRAPRRNDAGEIVEQGSVTAWLNGIKVQDETRFSEPRSVYHPFRYGTTDYLKPIAAQLKAKQIGPVFLQDHESPTKFRNVWIVPLDDLAIDYVPK